MMRIEEIHIICVYSYVQKSTKVYKYLFSCMYGGGSRKREKEKECTYVYK